MIRVIVIILLMHFSSQLRSQHSIIVSGNPCERSIFIKSKSYSLYPFNTVDSFLENYFSRTYPAYQVKIFYSAKELTPINNLWCLPESVRFQDSLNNKLFAIEIDLTRGTNFKPNEITKITCFYGDEKFTINDVMFFYFKSVNNCFSYGSMSPIKAFGDKDGHAVYLYLNSFTPREEIEQGYGISGSYLARIKIDLISKKSEVVHIPGKFLLNYGWLYCPDFWVF